MTRGFYHTLAIFTFAAAALLAFPGAEARYRYYDNDDDQYSQYNDPEPSRTPLFAIVGLKEQRVSIYDAKGKFMESPVSSGQTGLETPAGIYSIVQKEEDHHSNIYDDASMPFMERITWTGIALHAGVLPGYPASHGCVRMPESFAEKLYGLTSLGMRVIIVREDIAPAEVPQPAMFTAAAAPSGRDTMNLLRVAARTAAIDLDNAKRHDKEARAAAAKRNEEAKTAARAEQNAQAALERAEAALKEAEHTLETASEDKTASAEAAKAEAQAKLDAAQAQLAAAKSDAGAKAAAVQQAGEEVRAAGIALAKAGDAYDAGELNMYPVSVFISRKTQRLYIRKNNWPVYESDVLIKDGGKPIGTFVFTATDYTDQPGVMRWSLVSMYKDPANAASAEPAISPVSDKVKNRPVPSTEPAPANVAGAQEALTRIEIPQEAQARISAAVLPGSSLIISDEGPSIETGKDTDFVVVMSGEPQGGMSIRHHPKKNDGSFGDPWFGGHTGRGGFFLFN